MIIVIRHRRKKRRAKSDLRLRIEAQHRAYLEDVGLTTKKRPVQRSKKLSGYSLAVEGQPAPMMDTIPTGVAAQSVPKVYSGTRKLLGIAVLHKSCLVPVFSKEDAEDIAKMRR